MLSTISLMNGRRLRMMQWGYSVFRSNQLMTFLIPRATTKAIDQFVAKANAVAADDSQLVCQISDKIERLSTGICKKGRRIIRAHCMASLHLQTWTVIMKNCRKRARMRLLLLKLVVFSMGKPSSSQQYAFSVYRSLA